MDTESSAAKPLDADPGSGAQTPHEQIPPPKEQPSGTWRTWILGIPSRVAPLRLWGGNRLGYLRRSMGIRSGLIDWGHRALIHVTTVSEGRVLALRWR